MGDFMVFRLYLILLLSILLTTACNIAPSSLGDFQSPPDEPSQMPLVNEYSDLPGSTPTGARSTEGVETTTPIISKEREIISTSTPPPKPIFSVCSPLELHALENLSAIISGPYDPPPPGKDERHHGVDFGYWYFEDRTTMQGELVQSILPGVVAMVLHDLFPYGNTIMVETAASKLPEYLVEMLDFEPGESLYTLYAHLDSPPLMSLGEEVEACQLLGEVGLSGNTDVAHLHLETRLGPSGRVFESMMFYSTSATIAEMENYKLWRTSGLFRHFDPMILLLFNVP